MTEIGWHHRVNGHELGQTLRDGEGQGSLECCSLWRCKKLDMTCQLNNYIQYHLWNVFLKENYVIFFFSLFGWLECGMMGGSLRISLIM